MTLDQEHMVLDIARRVLAEPGASADRLAWADDAVRAIEHGDIAAARRIGMWDLPSAAKCPMCGEAHELGQCPRWRVPLAFSDPIAQEAA